MRFPQARAWGSLAVLLSATLGVSGCGDKSTKPNTEQTTLNTPPGPAPTPLGPTPPKPKDDTEELLMAKPDVAVSDTDFLAEFKKDPGLSKYNGKIVDVTGKVSMLRYSSGDGKPELFLDSTTVYFPCREIDALVRVAPGQTVTLRARCAPQVGLANCVIVKVEGESPPQMTADALAKAFAADEAATVKKYRGKCLVLTGKMQIPKEGVIVQSVLSSPGVKPEVKCEFELRMLQVAEKRGWLKEGTEVRILGRWTAGNPSLEYTVILPPAK